MTLKERYEKSLADQDISEIQNIISELNGMKGKEREEYLSFYERIGEDLFSRSSEPPNYNLEEFKRIEVVKTTKKTSKENKDNFHEVFIDFLKRGEKHCKSLKAHFLFQLDNNSVQETAILILTDNVSKHNPLIARILEVFPAAHKFTIDEFNAECKKNRDWMNKKFVCLLAMATNIITDEDSHSTLKALFELFTTSSFISLKKDEILTTRDYKLDTITEETFGFIQAICGKSFNNRDITFQEEMIIKKCFEDSTTPIIDYKMLKAGFSGSKVIEVQPLKVGTGSTGRFVIKFGKKDDEKKIRKEKVAFGNHIDDLNIPGYKGAFYETELYEAIKYNYASSDTKTDSHPFAELLKNHIKGKISLFSFDEVLSQLFNCKPFEAWNTPSTQIMNVLKLYNDFYNEIKLISSISIIDAISEDDVKKTPLWDKLEQIKEIEVECMSKTCHGDLHSENFFKDESGVYLIDFGYTKDRHAVIDHSTLETSIKFKHIPTYIPIEELIDLEKAALSLDTFHRSYKINSNRKILESLFGMCFKIRQDAYRFMSNKSSPLEYLISLFFITIRQIQYADLNQRYALRSAECIADEIIKWYNK